MGRKKNIIKIKKHFDMAAFSGAQHLPVNVTVLDRTAKGARPQYIFHAQDLAPDLRDFIYFLDTQSLNSPVMPFRETGAFAYYNKDGHLNVSWHTSNMDYRINSDDSYRSLVQIPLFKDLDDGFIPEHLIHIHTHPGIEYSPVKYSVLTSPMDYKSYAYNSALISYYAGQIIPVTGIVRPVGNSCGDVIIQSHNLPSKTPEDAHMQAQWLKGYYAGARTERQRADALRQQTEYMRSRVDPATPHI
jgi:hypothetical protein